MIHPAQNQAIQVTADSRVNPRFKAHPHPTA